MQEMRLLALGTKFNSSSVIVTPSGKEFTPDRPLTRNAARLELVDHERGRFGLPLDAPAPLLVRHSTHQLYIHHGPGGAKIAITHHSIALYEDGRLTGKGSYTSTYECDNLADVERDLLVCGLPGVISEEEVARAEASNQKARTYNEAQQSVLTIEHHHYASGHRVTRRAEFTPIFVVNPDFPGYVAVKSVTSVQAK